MNKAVILCLLVIQLVFALPVDRVGDWQSSSPVVVQGRRYTSAPASDRRETPSPLQYDVVRSPRLVVLGEEESVEHFAFDPVTSCVEISTKTDAYSWISSKNIGLDTILNGVSTQAFLIHVDRDVMIQPNFVRACGYSTDLSEAFETATISFNQDTPSESSKAERFHSGFGLYGVKPNDVFAVGHKILVSFEGAEAAGTANILVFANGNALATPTVTVNGASGKADIVVPATWASNDVVYQVVYRCTNGLCGKLEASTPSFTVPVGTVTFTSIDEDFELNPSTMNSVALQWTTTGYTDFNMRGAMILYRVGDKNALADIEIKRVVISTADADKKSKVFSIEDVKDDLIASPWSYYFKYEFNCDVQCRYANSPMFSVPLSYSHIANAGRQSVEDVDCSDVVPNPVDPFLIALKDACDINPKTKYRAELTTLKASAGVTINKFEFISNYYDHYEFFAKVTVHSAAEIRLEGKMDFAFDWKGVKKTALPPVVIADAPFSIAGVTFNYKADVALSYKVDIKNEGAVEFTVPTIVPIPDVWMEAGWGTGKAKHTAFGLASEFPLIFKPVDIDGVNKLTIDIAVEPRITLGLFDDGAVKQIDFFMTTEAFATLVSEYNADLFGSTERPEDYDNYEGHYPLTCNFKHRRHYTLTSGLRKFAGTVTINMHVNKFIIPFNKDMAPFSDTLERSMAVMLQAGCLQRAQCKMFYPNPDTNLAEFCPYSDLGAKCKLSCAKDYEGDKAEWVCENENWKPVTESTCTLKKDKSGLTTGDYVAITAGSIGGVGILAFIVVFAGKKRKRVAKGETLMPSAITGVVVESTVIDVENPKSYGTTVAASSSSSVASSSMNTTTGESGFATLPALSTSSVATPATAPATVPAATGAASPPAAAAAPDAAPADTAPVRQPSPEVRPASPKSGGAAIN